MIIALASPALLFSSGTPSLFRKKIFLGTGAAEKNLIY